MHVIAAKAVGFKEAMSEAFKADQVQVVENAKALAAALITRNFRLVSGGTDNHLFLVDLSNKDITGKEAEELLEQGGLTVNKNAIPFDSKPRFVTSGVRIGTPTITTRGLKVAEMSLIADWIERIISKRDQESITRVRQEVRELCAKFPLSAIVDPV
jgi:glycine hydroxymethyltransferase